MRIVSNTSPLIILKKSDAIFILDKLFECVLIPKNVKKELFKKERDFFEKLKILKVAKPKNINLAKALSLIVDEGEAEAIALSLEMKLPLLIDDKKGRKVADELKIKYIGTLGLLKIAKKRKIIKNVKPFIEKFLNKGYYIDKQLIVEFLKELNEY